MVSWQLIVDAKYSSSWWLVVGWNELFWGRWNELFWGRWGFPTWKQSRVKPGKNGMVGLVRYTILSAWVPTWGKWSYCWWTKSCTTKDDDYPIIYEVLTIPGGAGLLPSTVLLLMENKPAPLNGRCVSHYLPNFMLFSGGAGCFPSSTL